MVQPFFSLLCWKCIERGGGEGRIFFLGGSYNEKTMGVFCKMSAVQQHWKLLAVVSQVS